MQFKLGKDKKSLTKYPVPVRFNIKQDRGRSYRDFIVCL
jgi:hypothetical protein